jgi:hypothetical protein
MMQKSPSSQSRGVGEAEENINTMLSGSSVKEELWQSIAQHLGLADSAAREAVATAIMHEKSPENSGIIDPQQ